MKHHHLSVVMSCRKGGRYAHVSMSVNVHLCRGHGITSDIVLQVLHTLFLRKDLCLAWSSPIRLGWLGTRLPCLSTPGTRIIYLDSHVAYLLFAWLFCTQILGSNSDSHTCKTSILQTKSLPKPPQAPNFKHALYCRTYFDSLHWSC